MKKILLVLAALVLLPAGCGKRAATPTASPAPPTLKPADAYTPEFESSGCQFRLPLDEVPGETVDCGYLVVPENRSDPSRSIRLAVAIFHPEGGATEPDPIIYLSGGPGGSALEFLYLTFEDFAPALGAGRDLIFFDQRGVGRSKPALDCDEADALSLELLDREYEGKTLSNDEMARLEMDALAACAQELGKTYDLSAYNTAANAADVNDLRIALGYEEVNLWGISYGTRLALEVMRSFPEGIRSVVLDSVYPPDVDLFAESPPNLDRALSLVFDSCAADAACNAAYPNLRDTLFATVARLDANPAPLQVRDPFAGKAYDAALDGVSLLAIVSQLLYETEILPSVPALIYDASLGNYDLLAMIWGQLVAQQTASSQGMMLSVMGHDEVPFGSPGRLQAALDEHPELRALFEFTYPGTLAFEMSEKWDAGKASPEANQAVASDVPTLIMSGQFDPITPPDWGRHAAETLPNAFFFEYPAVGHGASAVEGCPQEMMLAFLGDPLPRPDGACIADMGIRFDTPGEAAPTVEFEPFVSQEFGIRGVLPVGWKEESAGAFTRGSTALDMAALLAQATPMGADFVAGSIAASLGQQGTPEPVGEREVNGLVWSLYAFDAPGLRIDMAVAESDGLTLLAVLQSAPAERDSLYETVFLPVVDALEPLD